MSSIRKVVKLSNGKDVLGAFSSLVPKSSGLRENLFYNIERRDLRQRRVDVFALNNLVD